MQFQFLEDCTFGKLLYTVLLSVGFCATVNIGKWLEFIQFSLILLEVNDSSKVFFVI